MVALSRCVSCVALLCAGAGAARVSRHRNSAQSAKFIAGVPVLNYQSAHGGKASLSEVVSDDPQDWIIMARPGTTDEQLANMCTGSSSGCILAGNPSSGGIPFVDIRATEEELEKIIAASAGAVRYVEPDSEVSMIPAIEVDAQAATWGLTRIGADSRSLTGAGSTVFVLDTGVRTTHQEFDGRASSALDMTSGSPVECNGNQNCAGDVQGHGTHCAGSAAGNSVGVAPSAAVRAVKVLADNGSGSWAWSYSALDWLSTNNERPAVASMSLGGTGTQQAMADAVDGAVSAGVVVVVAGGNSNSDACGFSPAFVPSAITVGSMDSNDARSSFSNYGACTNIWAPGSSVYSAGVSSDSAYATYSGTSMACPHVSGGVALTFQNNPSLSASGVLQELLADAEMNAISGLFSTDTNALLFVGDGGAPPSPAIAPPTSPPSNCPSWCSTGFCFFSSCRNNCDFCSR